MTVIGHRLIVHGASQFPSHNKWRPPKLSFQESMEQLANGLEIALGEKREVQIECHISRVNRDTAKFHCELLPHVDAFLSEDLLRPPNR